MLLNEKWVDCAVCVCSAGPTRRILYDGGASLRFANQGITVAGEPNGVAGINGVVFALAGVTACPEASAAASDDAPPNTGSVNDMIMRIAVLTSQTVSNVQKIGMDIRASIGTENGKMSNRISEASELSHENDLVLNSRCGAYPLPSTGKVWCRAK